jgi:hypothetical protein
MQVPLVGGTLFIDGPEIGHALMRSGDDERYDFFLSRRGSVAAIAREVADVLTERGYKVLDGPKSP